jgi:hypothetical protein
MTSNSTRFFPQALPLAAALACAAALLQPNLYSARKLTIVPAAAPKVMNTHGSLPFFSENLKFAQSVEQAGR